MDRDILPSRKIFYLTQFIIFCVIICITKSPSELHIPGFNGDMTSFGYFNPFQRLYSISAYYDRFYYSRGERGQPGSRNPGRDGFPGGRAENGQPGQNGEQGAPGPAGNRGRAGPQGPVVQDEQGRRGPAALKKVSRVRNEFPEAWIWTDIDSRYTLCDVSHRNRPAAYQYRQRYIHSFRYMLQTCVHPDAFWLRSSVPLVKIAWASSTDKGLIFPACRWLHFQIW